MAKQMTKEDRIKRPPLVTLVTFRDCCNYVAIKYKLGTTLVTGHRSTYWEEAAEIYKKLPEQPEL